MKTRERWIDEAREEIYNLRVAGEAVTKKNVRDELETNCLDQEIAEAVNAEGGLEEYLEALWSHIEKELSNDELETETNIAVMMEDGFTRNEAIASMKRGTTVYTDLEQMAADFETTVDEIRAGNAEDLDLIVYDGIEYGIAICH